MENANLAYKKRGFVKELGTYFCETWEVAFDIAREQDRPIVAQVGDDYCGKCYPSGNYIPMPARTPPPEIFLTKN